MKPCMDIGSRREVFFDDTMLDSERTTTVFRLHEPVQRECVLVNDEPWHAGGAVPYHQVLMDGDVYRMYSRCDSVGLGSVSYAESRDGIHWEKPALGIAEFNGSKENNLLFGNAAFDGFRVFIDENPACPPEERYKALADCGQPARLYLYCGPDGIHFRPMGEVKMKGIFDSVNTMLWNPETGTYQAFIRAYHPAGDPSNPVWTRDIRFAESETLFPKGGWHEPKPIFYSDMTDWHMYINSVMKYHRAPHVYIGFPSRYVQRQQWTDNYDELCGAEARRERFVTKDPRTALAVSDTLFMTSRDGRAWTRYPEAFLRPGPEHPTNWVYGSVYFSNGLVETPSSHPGCDRELSFYCVENRWFDRPPEVYRYSIRMDGFVSQFAPYPEASLVTRPFRFAGNELFLNFSTSAYGHLRVTLADTDGNRTTSADLFGDSTDRHVRFDRPLSDFAGKEVTMTCHMCDADLYSFRFDK